MVAVQKYVSVPLEVEAVEVTAENLEDVAVWCKGELRSAAVDENENPVIYIKVPVKKPRTERQTKAFVGDWILKTPIAIKVYNPIAFKKNFTPAV